MRDKFGCSQTVVSKKKCGGTDRQTDATLQLDAASTCLCVCVCVHVGPMLCVGVTRDGCVCLHLASPPGIPCSRMDM